MSMSSWLITLFSISKVLILFLIKTRVINDDSLTVFSFANVCVLTPNEICVSVFLVLARFSRKAVGWEPNRQSELGPLTANRVTISAVIHEGVA